MSSRKSCSSAFYTIRAQGCFARPLQGVAASQSSASRRKRVPHLHLSEHEFFAAPISGDGFEHDTTCQMEQGRCSLGCLLPPWGNNFWPAAGSSRGSVSTVLTLVCAADEAHGATSCLHPVPFPSGVCFCTATSPAKLGLAENSFPAPAGQDPHVAPHAAPPDTGENEPNGNPQPLSSAHLAHRIHNTPWAGVSSPGCQQSVRSF